MIKLIIGPMRSGKSLELLREAEKLHFGRKKYILIRPEIDDREFISRSYKTLHNLNIIKTNNINAIVNEYDYILLDEFQFFDNSITNIITDNISKNWVLCGLNINYESKLFENIINILPYADRIYKLSSICEKCGSEYGNHNISNTGEICVGDDYTILCSTCKLQLKG
ncbi:putative thymidine kinase [Campylobacter phage F372]|uniref:Thymidine kinase n=1 Tax=Campylobacter phage F372 TaxID=2794375 RepID=A0A7T3N5A0_9CAUD|nr:putative thymidine kinase [Campylobacter phage F372]